MRKKLRFKICITLFALNVILASCALLRGPATITNIEAKWGPPAKVENQNGKSIYYWHFNIVRFGVVNASRGWVVYEFTADEKGIITQKRKYWKQPDSKKDTE